MRKTMLQNKLLVISFLFTAIILFFLIIDIFFLSFSLCPFFSLPFRRFLGYAIIVTPLLPLICAVIASRNMVVSVIAIAVSIFFLLFLSGFFHLVNRPVLPIIRKGGMIGEIYGSVFHVLPLTISLWLTLAIVIVLFLLLGKLTLQVFFPAKNTSSPPLLQRTSVTDSRDLSPLSDWIKPKFPSEESVNGTVNEEVDQEPAREDSPRREEENGNSNLPEEVSSGTATSGYSLAAISPPGGTGHTPPLETPKDSDAVSSAVYPENVRVVKKQDDEPAAGPLTPGETIVPAYSFPQVDLLNQGEKIDPNDIDDEIQKKAQQLLRTLEEFKIKASLDTIVIGPVLTRFEISIVAGIKVSRVVGLSDDIALSLAVTRIRIIAPIPGKSAIGIEIPNSKKSVVCVRDILESKAFRSSAILPFALGKDIEGTNMVTDIRNMPHLIIAGATGSGKSVCVNSMIVSLLYHCDPQQVKFILIDPKVVELKPFDDIPHLLFPVVTDMKQVTDILKWLVKEMDHRYELISDLGTRNIEEYNQRLSQYNKKVLPREERENLPYVVLVIDEFADLMAISSNEVENIIMRLAQKARAIGIHLVLATQRPSVDVITGVIKANFPERIAFQTTSRTDSRTILDANGAEKLIGQGDMLYQSGSAPGLTRIQGALVTTEEVDAVADFVRRQGSPKYIDLESEQPSFEDETFDDPMYEKAVDVTKERKKISTSMLQRHLRIGYNRAARIIDKMEAEGIISGPDGVRPRQLLI